MSKSSKGRTKPGRQQVKSKKKKQPQRVSNREYIEVRIDDLFDLPPSEQLERLLERGAGLKSASNIVHTLPDIKKKGDEWAKQKGRPPANGSEPDESGAVSELIVRIPVER